jgi:hypothetical protein
MIEYLKNKIDLISRLVLIFVLLTILSGNVTNSFLLKYGFREDFEPPLVISMMDGEAKKPWAFRSLAPIVIDRVVNLIQKDTQNYLFEKIKRYDSLRKSYFPNLEIAYWTPRVALVYHAMYLLIGFSFFATLVFLYKLVFLLNNGNLKLSLLSVIIFSFLYPLTFQNGGYFYDFFELLGIFSATYFFISNKMGWTCLSLFLSSWNKETMFLFAIFLCFLHPSSERISYKIKWSLVHIIICLPAYVYMQLEYAKHRGGVVETHFIENIYYWINPLSYIRFANLIGRGVATPEINNILFLLPMFYWIKLGWSLSEKNYRNFFAVSFGASFVLLLLFGYKNEVRNLSLAFPGFFLLMLRGGSTFFDSIIALPPHPPTTPDK